MSWGIEAARDGRTAAASKVANFPGELEDHLITGRLFIPPWRIDAVLNERLLASSPQSGRGRRLDLKNWNSIAKLMNTYGRLSNVESGIGYAADGILPAMQRLFWPQYDWQIGYQHLARVGRAWNSYATPEGKIAFRRKHGLELEAFLKVTFEIYAQTDKFPAVQTAFLNKLGHTREDIHRTCLAIGGNLNIHAACAKTIRDPALPRDFQRSSLKERPIVEVKEDGTQHFYIPSREMLLLRVTDGLYYDIVDDGRARNASGASFELLCKEIITHYSEGEGEVSGEVDTSYGKSADILHTLPAQNQAIIYECKARRLPQRILVSPNPWGQYPETFNDLATGIFQIWRTHTDLIQSHKIDSVGIVVLYDPWTLMGNTFVSELFQKANEEANQNSIPNCCRVPVAVVGFFDLERCLRRYSSEEIRIAVIESTLEKYFGYELSSVCSDLFPKKDRKAPFDFSHAVKNSISWWAE